MNKYKPYSVMYCDGEDSAKGNVQPVEGAQTMIWLLKYVQYHNPFLLK